MTVIDCLGRIAWRAFILKCPKCQTENPKGAKFCRKCAQSLQTELVGPQCGHTNLPGGDFCTECSYPLAEPAPAPTVQPSPEPNYFVSGRYQLKQFLGEGGMKAWSESLRLDNHLF